MEKRRVGNSDLHITQLWNWSLGHWRQWVERHMGPQNESDSIPAIHAALEHGLNWIDTAALYGLGHSEEMVARNSRPNAKAIHLHEMRTSMGCGRIGPCLKAKSVRRECEDSLRRLKVDSIDLYQIHWPQPDEDIEEGWTELARLKDEGKVRWIGVSNFSVAQMKRAQAIAPITSLQPPYAVVRREIEQEVLPFCLSQNIGVIVYSPMYAGLLTGAMTTERVASFLAEDWRRNLPGFKEPDLSRNLRVVEHLREIGRRGAGLER